jgi:F-type H+-transporting ATPase subunit b
MDLNWQAVLTQALGFFIVVLLLKKYAWTSILEFTENRRKHIATELDDIESAKVKADELRQQLENELEGIEDTRREKIHEAVTDANAVASDIKDDARKEAVALREKTAQDVNLQLEKANATLRDRMTDAVITTAERVINERLDSDKHRELIVGFLNEIDLKEETR